VQVMSRHDCGLCEHAVMVVKQAAEQGLCTWESIDVDRDKSLLVRYGMDVPVVLVNGELRFRHRLESGALMAELGGVTC